MMIKCSINLILDVVFRMDSSSLPDHIKQYFCLINEQQSDPILLKGFLDDWPASSWRPDNLHSVFLNESLTFRVGKKKIDGNFNVK